LPKTLPVLPLAQPESAVPQKRTAARERAKFVMAGPVESSSAWPWQINKPLNILGYIERSVARIRPLFAPLNAVLILTQ
jgi:hypothetical protein